MAYAEISDEFPHLEFAEADLLFHHSESSLQEMVTLMQIEGKDKEVLRKLEVLRDDYVKYLSLIKSMCQGIWAKFDTSSMLLGFTTVLTAFVMVIFVFDNVSWRSQSYTLHVHWIYRILLGNYILCILTLCWPQCHWSHRFFELGISSYFYFHPHNVQNHNANC